MVDSDLEPLHGRVRRIVLTQTTRTRHDGGESVDRSSRRATFDRAGRVTERTWLVPSGASSRTVYRYDDGGRLVETAESGTNPDGAEWSFTRTYAYADHGRLVEERHAPALGEPTVTRHPVYLPDGRRTEVERFPARWTFGEVLFETDAAGRITAIRQFGEHAFSRIDGRHGTRAARSPE